MPGPVWPALPSMQIAKLAPTAPFACSVQWEPREPLAPYALGTTTGPTTEPHVRHALMSTATALLAPTPQSVKLVRQDILLQLVAHVPQTITLSIAGSPVYLAVS